MNVAIYGDVHLTKKMSGIQSYWDDSALRVFSSMYNRFSELDVESAICLGDFFDAPRLEAKSVKLVTEILSLINNSSFPTYFLLGNHEIFDDDSNILDYLSEYDNIIPVTEVKEYEGKVFVPYNVNLEDLPEDLINGKYLFTHHDIYGSELAGGKVKASFGTNPRILQGARRVFNGHVHLNSAFGNIINVGSILKSQQGELRVGEHPSYYVLYTDTGNIIHCHVTDDYIAPLTLNSEEYPCALDMYPPNVKFLLRLSYKDESQVLNIDSDPRILKFRIHKDVSNSSMESADVVRRSIDIKELITTYIHKDDTVAPEDKEHMVSLGLSLLGG